MRRLAPVLGLLVLAAGCGNPGPPLPPLRFVPAPVRDLSIHQQGSELIFRLSHPQTAVNGLPLPGLDAVEIWEMVVPLPADGVAPQVDPQSFARAAAKLFTLQGPELESAITGEALEARIALREPLPEVAELHVFGVRTRSTTAEISALSNPVQLLLRTTIAPPHSLAARPRPEGVELSWQDDASAAIGYHVYRRAADVRGYGAPIADLEPGSASYVDRDATYGSRYIYTVRALASREPLIESAPAGEQEIDYQDRFAPAPPRNLLALAESGQIRLAWEASPDGDTVGYHLYRQDVGADYRRITAEPVAALEYLDRGLTPGLGYSYRATAVDDVGNEGEAGNTSSATVQ